MSTATSDTKHFTH